MKMISDSIESTLPNYTLADVLQQDRIFTVEWTIDLVVALLMWRINSTDGKLLISGGSDKTIKIWHPSLTEERLSNIIS
jgi:WD40 repeat protein